MRKRQQNPFKPTFGASPPVLAGRDHLLQSFDDALFDGPGSPGRATLYTGARGSGKTALLNAIEGKAGRDFGWVVVSETATPGLVGRLTQTHLPGLLSRFDPQAVGRNLSQIGFPVTGGSLSWTSINQHAVTLDLRAQVSLLTDLLRENETGLLITVDEIHKHQAQDLKEIATAVQHAFREDRDLALAAAGLESSVSDILADDVLTFLRRADRHHLGPVKLDDVREALAVPVAESEKHVEEAALKIMVEATQGYPFMIQLVGYQSWQQARSDRVITDDHAVAGSDAARRRLGALVHSPALSATSDVDKSFLLAMAKDEGPSKMADIIERMGVKKEYAGVYRHRLIGAEVIEPAGHGYVDFTIPYLREYLREHAASLVASLVTSRK
ncbi:MAG: ATP-binding protein [Solirubrobacterales bacterium]|nr:ATP-binding protein [Solirubrobacterales bacterium]